MAAELGQQLGEVACFLRERRGRPGEKLTLVDAVCAVPFFENRALSVPHVLAAKVAEALQVEDLSSHVSKTRSTEPSKFNSDHTVDGTQFTMEAAVRGRRIAVVDDVVMSGATLASLAKALLRDGAHSAEVGLCATRARYGMSED
jgi:predicted amidophosphoribosyltransferase